jgi:hypothetical protein
MATVLGVTRLHLNEQQQQHTSNYNLSCLINNKISNKAYADVQETKNAGSQIKRRK